VYLPFSKNLKFVGRQSKLEILERRLFTAPDCQRLAVVGLGGIGKTQLVLSFAYLVIERRPDMSIFWIPALSAETFERATETIAQQLGLRSIYNRGEDTKELLKQHLSTAGAGRWLLVVDNADDIDILERSATKEGLLRYIPESPLGVTIFTTRTSAVAQRVARSDVLRLERPTEDEALELLRTTLADEGLLEDIAAAKDLLKELEYLPLAITQATAYININHTSISDYLKILQSTDDDVVDLMRREIRDSTRYGESSSSVATTWLVSFKQIVERDFHAATLLQFISCIEWKGIPRSILPTGDSEVRMTEAIGTLRAYSFLSEHTDRSGTTYDMHRLVHLASRIWTRADGLSADALGQAIAHLANIFPIYKWENREIWRAYLPHVTRMRVDWQRVDVSAEGLRDKRIRLSWLVSNCLISDSRDTEALHWAEESCRLSSHLAEEDPERIVAQQALAHAHHLNRQIKKAIKILEHVVAIRETSLANDHLNRLSSQHALAHAYLDNGQSKDAIKLFEHVVAVQETLLTEDDPDRLISQHELARAYIADRQIKDAVKLLEGVVAFRETSLAEDHPHRLSSQHWLACAYLDNGQTKDAIKLLESVFAIQRASRLEDNPCRLASQGTLACAYWNNGPQTKDAAIQLMEHVVTVQETSLPEDHPDRSNAEDWLAHMRETHSAASSAAGSLCPTLAERLRQRLASFWWSKR
jgi:tetratricopeptide (TPR) repeat protein